MIITFLRETKKKINLLGTRKERNKFGIDAL